MVHYIALLSSLLCVEGKQTLPAGEENFPTVFPTTAASKGIVPTWLVMLSVWWSHVEFVFYIKASWFPFISLQNSQLIYLFATSCRRGEDFNLEILLTRPKQIKVIQQPLFPNWVPFSASEMKMMCMVKHCTGVANSIIFRRWCFGGRKVTRTWA